jgi:hypothetical protein
MVGTGFQPVGVPLGLVSRALDGPKKFLPQSAVVHLYAPR